MTNTEVAKLISELENEAITSLNNRMKILTKRQKNEKGFYIQDENIDAELEKLPKLRVVEGVRIYVIIPDCVTAIKNHKYRFQYELNGKNKSKAKVVEYLESI